MQAETGIGEARGVPLWDGANCKSNGKSLQYCARVLLALSALGVHATMYNAIDLEDGT